MRRTLTLRKDTLTELASGDLAAVAAGNTPGCTLSIEIACITERLTTAVGPTVTVVTTLTGTTGEFTFQCTANC